MLTILGKETSINVRKVLWTCRLLDLRWQLEPWGSGVRDPNVPEFLALNPNAQVPVLRDGDTVLWESNTICRYLVARQGDSTLLPADPLRRARVEQWMDWQATELNPAWRPAFMALVRHSDRFDANDVADSTRDWNGKMRILDGRLTRTGAFVCGDDFTLADVVLALSVHRWRMTPIAHERLPAVEGYLRRLESIPGHAEYCRPGTP
ncbi:glutathione S-transferase family protein [Pyxidicoccus fallax]|uniref:Glutathione S-transferase family protein n=1 Tax=Pyxidicoccus fallax TaxID=394095 RepID=A0A848LFA2_9BACT|nr:glutathione S-transferase family protein [Pyxidicoccus fallax]NMO15663.1 glutathione S-transferase family protein [Pyxidicoccus fallax]NPC78783.1 glutathione S-transferase family protein [Pyxidicoccus fallax]